MLSFHADPEVWAALNFADVELGNVLRTRRLLKFAADFAQKTDASLPQICSDWSDLKATYKLLARPEATFQAVCQPHFDLRLLCGNGRWLVLSDTTEIDLGKHRKVSGMGPLGNGSGKGLLLHSALLVNPANGQLQCLAGALLESRKPAPKNETAAQKRSRRRETDRWGELIDQVGRPPEGATWVHVMDRESDNYDVFLHCLQQGCGWVSRARALSRHIQLPIDPDDPAATPKVIPLEDFLSTLPIGGTSTLEVAAKSRTRREKARTKRTAELEIRWGMIVMPRPKPCSLYAKVGVAEVPMWVVWAREKRPPAGEEAISWVLYSSDPITDLESALGALREYGIRWQHEEWHKALKTGTKLKRRQLESRASWEPMIGVSMVEAVRLIQMRSLSETEPDRPAAEVVPSRYIKLLLKELKYRAETPLTLREFWHGVARMGGFIGRRRDGEPGWQTIWRGWEKLTLMVRGADALADPPDPKNLNQSSQQQR